MLLRFSQHSELQSQELPHFLPSAWHLQRDVMHLVVGPHLQLLLLSPPPPSPPSLPLRFSQHSELQSQELPHILPSAWHLQRDVMHLVVEPHSHGIFSLHCRSIPIVCGAQATP